VTLDKKPILYGVDEVPGLVFLNRRRKINDFRLTAFRGLSVWRDTNSMAEAGLLNSGTMTVSASTAWLMATLRHSGVL
jgi:hypothetical protein